MSHVSQENPRDTQFAGFAKLLLQEMLGHRDAGYLDFTRDDTDEIEEYSTVIAQRAYDLAEHTLRQAALKMKIIMVASAYMAYIPDLAEWPEENP